MVIYKTVCNDDEIVCNQVTVPDPPPASAPADKERIAYDSGDNKKHPSRLEMIPFNRAINTVQGSQVAPTTDKEIVWSIVDSKVLLSGTVLIARGVPACERYDWSVTPSLRNHRMF